MTAILILMLLVASTLQAGCHVIQGVVNGEILPHPTPQVKYTYTKGTGRVLIQVIVPYDPRSAIIIDFAPFDHKRTKLEEFTTCENRNKEAFPSGWTWDEFLGTIADTNNFGDKVNPMWPQTGGAGMWRRSVVDCANVMYTLDANISDILSACGGKIMDVDSYAKSKTELTVFVTYATPIDDGYTNGISTSSFSVRTTTLEEVEETGGTEEVVEEIKQEEQVEEEKPVSAEEDLGDDWYTDPDTIPSGPTGSGGFNTVTHAFSVTIDERLAIENMKSNTKLSTLKLSGPRVMVRETTEGEEEVHEMSLVIDITATANTQVSICNPVIKDSPQLPKDATVRTVGGSCTCSKPKYDSTSTLHNLIIASKGNILPGTTNGNYTINITEITCTGSGATAKVAKSNDATIKFTLNSVIETTDIQPSGVQYSNQAIYSKEGWGYKTFEGYSTSLVFEDMPDSLYSSSITYNPYVSLFASHPLGTPFYGSVSSQPIRYFLFSTPMSLDRMGIKSAYACVVGQGWNGTSEGTGNAGTKTLPRNCPSSVRKELKIRSCASETRSKETDSFFLSGDIFATLDLTSAANSQVLFVITGEQGVMRLYADPNHKTWRYGTINAYEGVVDIPSDDKPSDPTNPDDPNQGGNNTGDDPSPPDNPNQGGDDPGENPNENTDDPNEQDPEEGAAKDEIHFYRNWDRRLIGFITVLALIGALAL